MTPDSDRDVMLRGHLEFALHDIEKVFQRYGADDTIPRFIMLRVELENVRGSVRAALARLPKITRYEGEDGG